MANGGSRFIIKGTIGGKTDDRRIPAEVLFQRLRFSLLLPPGNENSPDVPCSRAIAEEDQAPTIRSPSDQLILRRMPGHDDLVPAFSGHNMEIALRWGALFHIAEGDEPPVRGDVRAGPARRDLLQDPYRTIRR
jgi:hypothetical protein